MGEKVRLPTHPKFGETPEMKAWAERREKRRQEMAAAKERKRTERAMRQPLDNQERVALEIAKRSVEPIEEFKIEPTGYTDLWATSDLIKNVSSGTESWPLWCRDGSREDALNYGYLWHPVSMCDEKLQQTIRAYAIPRQDGGNEFVLSANAGVVNPAGSVPVDVKIWRPVNRQLFPWLSESDVEPMGCVSRRVRGELFLLLACRREMYEFIYGKAHSKEERLAGAKDRPGLSGLASAAVLGRFDSLPEHDGRFHRMDHRIGVAPDAAQKEAHVVLNLETLDREGGYIRHENPEDTRSPFVMEKDGLPGVASERPRDLPELVPGIA